MKFGKWSWSGRGATGREIERKGGKFKARRKERHRGEYLKEIMRMRSMLESWGVVEVG